MNKTTTTFSFVVCMIVAMATGAPCKAADKVVNVSPVIMKMRTSYKYVFEGVPEDLEKYERFLSRAEAKVKKAKTDSSRDKYDDIVKMLQDMIEAYKAVENMFNGTGKSMAFENALRQIPDLETRLRLDAKVDVERQWLTPDEVRKRLQAGWRYKNCPKGVLPYSQKIWYRPKEGRGR